MPSPKLLNLSAWALLAVWVLSPSASADHSPPAPSPSAPSPSPSGHRCPSGWKTLGDGSKCFQDLGVVSNGFEECQRRCELVNGVQACVRNQHELDLLLWEFQAAERVMVANTMDGQCFVGDWKEMLESYYSGDYHNQDGWSLTPTPCRAKVSERCVCQPEPETCDFSNTRDWDFWFEHSGEHGDYSGYYGYYDDYEEYPYHHWPHHEAGPPSYESWYSSKILVWVGWAPESLSLLLGGCFFLGFLALLLVDRLPRISDSRLLRYTALGSSILTLAAIPLAIWAHEDPERPDYLALTCCIVGGLAGAVASISELLLGCNGKNCRLGLTSLYGAGAWASLLITISMIVNVSCWCSTTSDLIFTLEILFAVLGVLQAGLLAFLSRALCSKVPEGQVLPSGLWTDGKGLSNGSIVLLTPNPQPLNLAAPQPPTPWNTQPPHPSAPRTINCWTPQTPGSSVPQSPSPSTPCAELVNPETPSKGQT